MRELSTHTFINQARDYLLQSQEVKVPGWSPKVPFEVYPLAQGEYSMNFVVQQGQFTWVLRVNTGTQIELTHQEQILYEFKTLQLLEPTGIGPTPYFVDHSFLMLPYGILGMSYLQGEPLDYRRDLADAARLFTRYHQLEVPQENNHLIQEEHPLSLTYQRCLRMLQVYLESDLADPQLSAYLKEVRSWANEARLKEKYYHQDPYRCIINTEVNNTNWILNRQAGTIHLVDWEKPLWGDPSQDLSHFRVPTTTLWKTNYLMNAEDQSLMMTVYKQGLSDPHLRDTIEERTALRDPFNCLRGVSWCAMAWVQYQRDQHLLKNQDTFQKLSMYTDINFVRGLFDPYMHG